MTVDDLLARMTWDWPGERQCLRTLLSADGWFWFVTVPGLLSHSSAERYGTKRVAREAGQRAYPLARVAGT